MKIRLECTLPELAGNWVDMSDVWTRGEVTDWYRGAVTGNDAITLPILERKLVNVHIYLADGTLVSTAQALMERLNDLDYRLARWLPAAVMAALKEMMALGEASRRLLFDGIEAAAPTKKPSTEK